MDENEIATSELKSHQNLKVLSLRKNKLTSCAGIERLYNLHTLILEENEIATLKGLSVLPKMTTLNLKTNKLEKLDDLPRLEMIEDLQLDANAIASADEIVKLKENTTLSSLSMGGNPFADEKGDDFKKEVLVALMDHLPKLKLINGEPYDEEVKTEAIALKEERRLAAEEAAKNPPPAEEAPAEDAE